MEKLNELIAKCVLGNVMFPGQLGSQAYNVQDLVHTASTATLNNMWQKLKKDLSALDTDSLFKSSSSARKNKLSLQVETVANIFDYKQAIADEAKNRAKLKEEAVKKLTLLTHAKEVGEIDRIQSLSPKELAKEIKKAEKLAGV